MKELIAEFSTQFQKGIEISENYQFKIDNKININNIILSGLGGSGIAASIVQNFAVNHSKKPIVVSKNYHLPKFANENTLLICSSYSGNTEEAIAAMKEGIEYGCKIICITSGGKMLQIAKGNNIDCIVIPSGLPPRACLGYAIIQFFAIFDFLGILEYDYKKDFLAAAETLNVHAEEIQSQAQNIAQAIAFKTPIIYTENDMEGVGVRWRQQFNENGKMLCWHNVIPEMNHNEIVGWRDQTEERSVIFLRSSYDHERSALRMSLNKATIEAYTPNVFEITAKGDSFIGEAMYLVHLGDWISWYLAEERKFDATEVKVIDKLKADLCN